MPTFVTASVLVWLALAIYVARMGLRQRQLQQRVEQLLRDASSSGSPLSSSSPSTLPPSRAA